MERQQHFDSFPMIGGGGTAPSDAAVAHFSRQVTQLLSQRTHYYDAGLKKSDARIYYDPPRACFVLQKKDGQHQLQEDGLLAFLAEDIHKNVSSADGDQGLTKLLAMRLKAFGSPPEQQQANGGGATPSDATVAHFMGQVTRLLSQRTHYYDAGLKGSTALIYYDLPRACFLLQRNKGQYPLDEPRLLEFLAADIRKNISPAARSLAVSSADGDQGLTKLLAMRLKAFGSPPEQQQANGGGATPSDATVAHFMGQVTRLLSQRTHYYDAGLKGSTALIYYDLPRACFLLQRNKGQYPLDEPRLLEFLAADIRKNIPHHVFGSSPDDHVPKKAMKLLAMRLKAFGSSPEQQQASQQQMQQMQQMLSRAPGASSTAAHVQAGLTEAAALVSGLTLQDGLTEKAGSVSALTLTRLEAAAWACVGRLNPRDGDNRRLVLGWLQSILWVAVPGSSMLLFGSTACELHAHGADLDLEAQPSPSPNPDPNLQPDPNQAPISTSRSSPAHARPRTSSSRRSSVTWRWRSNRSRHQASSRRLKRWIVRAYQY